MRYAKLGDLGTIISGTTPSTTKNEYWNGNIPWVTPAELTENSHHVFDTERMITAEGMKSCSLSLMPINTVMLSSRAPIGKVAIAKKEMCCNQGFKNIMCGKELEPEYLYWFLKGKTAYLNSLGRGATFKEISKGIVENIEIPLPPLPEQKRIAEMLDKAQGLIDLRRRQIEEMDRLAQAVFIDMFGDPVRNEKGWDAASISSLATIQTGSTPLREKTEYYDYGNIPWIKTGEVSGETIFSSEEFITDKAVKETNCKVFPQGTILIAMYGQGTTRGKAGILGIEAATNQACAAILPSVNYNSVFLFKLLCMCYENLRNMGRGGNQPNLNLGMIKDYIVINPPTSIQSVYERIFNAIECQKSELKKGLLLLEQNYNVLMQQFFKVN